MIGFFIVLWEWKTKMAVIIPVIFILSLTKSYGTLMTASVQLRQSAVTLLPINEYGKIGADKSDKQNYLKNILSISNDAINPNSTPKKITICFQGIEFKGFERDSLNPKSQEVVKKITGIAFKSFRDNSQYRVFFGGKTCNTNNLLNNYDNAEKITTVESPLNIGRAFSHVDGPSENSGASEYDFKERDMHKFNQNSKNYFHIVFFNKSEKPLND